MLASRCNATNPPKRLANECRARSSLIVLSYKSLRSHWIPSFAEQDLNDLIEEGERQMGALMLSVTVFNDVRDTAR